MSVKDAKINYEFLDSSKNFLYDARETGKTHTSFQYELLLFTAIKNGDIHGVESALNLYQTSGLIIGHMSDNQSREIHYWAVATIAVAIHYAMFVCSYAPVFGNRSITLNRSPSISSCSFPPCSSVRLCAMDNPSPLPSVFLELSPRTNRSISSSLLMFSCDLEILRNRIITIVLSSRTVT